MCNYYIESVIQIRVYGGIWLNISGVSGIITGISAEHEQTQ